MTNHVRLMHYDPSWRQEFRQSRSNLLHSCRGWVTAVEHIGSTAISGLISRPTIDMIAAVATEQDAQMSMETATTFIEGLNYSCVDSPDWMNGQGHAICLSKPRHSLTPTHHVLLVSESSPIWKRTLQVRDWLRNDPEAAIRFEEMKVSRWQRGEGDLESYQTGKAAYFAHLEDQIQAEFGNT